jgi:hypothetical protein
VRVVRSRTNRAGPSSTNPLGDAIRFAATSPSVPRLKLVDGWRGQDFVGGFGSDERPAAVVVGVDEGTDRGDEFFA